MFPASTSFSPPSRIAFHQIGHQRNPPQIFIHPQMRNFVDRGINVPLTAGFEGYNYRMHPLPKPFGNHLADQYCLRPNRGRRPKTETKRSNFICVFHTNYKTSLISLANKFILSKTISLAFFTGRELFINSRPFSNSKSIEVKTNSKFCGQFKSKDIIDG